MNVNRELIYQVTRTLTEDVAICTLRNTFRGDGQTDRTQQVGGGVWGGHQFKGFLRLRRAKKVLCPVYVVVVAFALLCLPIVHNKKLKLKPAKIPKKIFFSFGFARCRMGFCQGLNKKNSSL